MPGHINVEASARLLMLLKPGSDVGTRGVDVVAGRSCFGWQSWRTVRFDQFDAGRIVGDGVVARDVEEVFVNVPLAELVEDAEPRFVAPAFPRLAPPLLLSL